MDSKLHKKLSKRQEEGTLRSLSSFEGCIDFFSNDYLGYANEGIESLQSGSSGSRLLSGNSARYEALEQEIARFYKVPSCLHFNSGYDANLGIFSSIPQKGDVVVYDELIHASVRDGLRLSWAQSFSFRHNDLEHLEQRLLAAAGSTVYIAVEALYSMDGDLAPLMEIVLLAEKYGAYLIVDEAHSSGVIGSCGKGCVDALDLTDRVFIRLHTFGKAYGSHGSCVLSDASTRDYLINYCRPFIYSTALPEYVAAHNLQRLQDASLEERRAQLHENIRFFRELYSGGSPSSLESPIQILPFGSAADAKTAADRLQKQGFAVKPIFPPTVPEGKERLRVCLHAFNTVDEIRALVESLC